jgi:hypothetical protein
VAYKRNKSRQNYSKFRAQKVPPELAGNRENKGNKKKVKQFNKNKKYSTMSPGMLIMLHQYRSGFLISAF